MIKLLLRQGFIQGVAFLLLLAGGCRSEARRDRHLHRAEDYFSREKYPESVIEYMQVLRLDSTNSAAIRGLGMAHAATGNLRAAIPFLLAAAGLYPDDLNLQASAAGVYIMAGEYERARTVVEHILQVSPDSLTGYLLLADTARTGPEAASVLARLEQEADRFATEAGYHAAMGELHLRIGNRPAAEASLREALRIQPGLARVHQVLGQVHLAAGENEKAAAAFQGGADLAPDDPVVQVRLAQFRIHAGDRAGARHVLDAILAARPESELARMEMAKLNAGDRRFDDALAILDSILATSPDHVEAVLLRSRVWMAINRAGESLTALETLAKRLPGDPRILFELGLAHLSNRETAKAAAALDRAVEIAPDVLPARLLRCEVYIRRGNAGDVVTDLRDILQKNPGNEKAHLLLGAACQALGQHANASAAYRGLLDIKPREAHYHYLLATSLLAEGSAEDARSALDKARELDPGYMQALYLLTEMDVRSSRHSDALDRIRRQLGQAPQDARLLYLQAMVLMHLREFGPAEESLGKVIATAPDMLDAYMMLGRLYALTGRNDEALAKIKGAIAVAPRNLGALTLAAVLEGNAGNRTGAMEYYRQAIAIRPDFFPALNNLAYLLAEYERDLDQAFELGQRAREAAPENPLVADTLGWIVYRQGNNYPWAYALIREAADRLADNPELNYHLGMAQTMLGREAEAAASLGKALAGEARFPGADAAAALLAVLEIVPGEAVPEDRGTVNAMLAIVPAHPAALLRLAAIEAREGSLAAALARGEGILKSHPDFLPAIVQMALFHEQRGDYDKALALARDAQAKSGEDPQIKALAGWMAYRSGQHAWAAGLLRSAADALPGQARIQYRAGAAELALGRTASARIFMDRALQQDAKSPDAERTRQALAMLNLAEGLSKEEKDLQAARLALSGDPEDPAALYAVVSLLRRQGDEPVFITAAERLLERFPLFTPVMRDLAAVYLRRREELERAYALAAQVRREQPSDPHIGMILGKLAHLRGEHDYAVTLLGQAVGRDPEDAEALYMLGFSQDAAGQRTEAMEVLTRALNLAPEAPQAAEARERIAEARAR